MRSFFPSICVISILLAVLVAPQAKADFPIWIERNCSGSLCDFHIKLLTYDQIVKLNRSKSIFYEGAKANFWKDLKDMGYRSETKDGLTHFYYKAPKGNQQIALVHMNDKNQVLQAMNYAFSGNSSGLVKSGTFRLRRHSVVLGLGTAFNHFEQSYSKTKLNYSSLVLPTGFLRYEYLYDDWLFGLSHKMTPGKIKADNYQKDYLWQKTSADVCKSYIWTKRIFGQEISLDLCGRVYRQSLSYFELDLINQTLSAQPISFSGVEAGMVLRTGLGFLDEVALEISPSIPFGFSKASSSGGFSYSGGATVKKYLTSRMALGVNWYGDWMNFKVQDYKITVLNSTFEGRIFYSF